MRKSLLVLILIVVFIFFKPGILSLLIVDLPGNSQPDFSSAERIYADKIIIQNIISNVNNLSGIGVSLKNPNLREQNDVTLVLYDKNNEILRSTKLNGKHIPDGGFIKFKFDPVVDSMNQEFSFQIINSSSKADNNIEVFKTQRNLGDGFELNINDNKDSQNISFVLFDKVQDHGSVLRSTYIDWWEKFSGDLYFAVFYTILVAGLSLYLFKIRNKS